MLESLLHRAVGFPDIIMKAAPPVKGKDGPDGPRAARIARRMIEFLLRS
jgi:hypothetical protein